MPSRDRFSEDASRLTELGEVSSTLVVAVLPGGSSPAGRRRREAAEASRGRPAARRRLETPKPLQAIEDLLRFFPADELIIVTPPGSEADWLEEDTTRETLERLGLPSTHLAVGKWVLQREA